MAMDNSAWGTAVANAIQGLGVVAGTPISPSQLETMWQTIKGEDVTHLVDNAEVSDVVTSGTVTSGPGAGGSTAGTGVGSITA